MTETEIIFYGVNWCWQSRRARRFLDKHNVPYKFINIDKDEEGEQFVLENNNGMRSVPTIVFLDKSVLVEPSNSQIEDTLRKNQSLDN